MQLIMDTEPTADITDKMTTIQDPLDTNLKNSLNCVKTDAMNGNKENIESQKNIIENLADITNGDDLKYDSSETVTPAVIMETENEVEERLEDSGIKTEHSASEHNICETTNGIHSTTEIHDVKEMCENTKLDEENVKVKNKLEDKIIPEKTSDSEEIATKVKEDNTEVLNRVNFDHPTEDADDTSLSNKEPRNTDSECLKSSVVDPNLEKESSLDIKCVKSLAEETSRIDSSMDIDEEDVEISTNDVAAEADAFADIEVLDVGIDDITKSNLTEIDSKPKETGEDKENEIEEKTSDSKNHLDELTAETIINDKVEKTLEILDTAVEDESKVEEAVTSTLDVEVKSKESNKENSGNDTQKNTSDEIEIVEDGSDKIIETANSTIENSESNSVEDMTCEVVDGDESVQAEAKDKEEILDIDEFLKDVQDVEENTEVEKVQEATEPAKPSEPSKAPICKLSNTLDILSDDDEDPLQPDSQNKTAVATSTTTTTTEKQCINIEDDDDIMLIDEDTDSKDGKNEPIQPKVTEEKKEETVEESTIDLESSSQCNKNKNIEDEKPVPTADTQKNTPPPEKETESVTQTIEAKPADTKPEKIEEQPKKSLLAENFLKGYKKNLADMTRDELEEFCVLKIVEGIVDRSNLSDIKSKLKTMAQNIDEYKKKAMMLSKQNRDLQLVLKSVQEEQKKNTESAIIPLKITRSVGMQVLMTEKPVMRKKGNTNQPIVNNNVNTKVTNTRTSNQSPRQQKQTTSNQQIPVPRLVPAVTNPAVKAPTTVAQANTATNTTKTNSQGQTGLNGMKVVSPAQKTAEKRTFTRAQSVTVDLTDDEPPSKVTPRSSPAPPVRLVSPQNLLARPQFTQSLNNPRKVYIPISGPQGQNIRPGQTIMLKSAPPPGQRHRAPGPHTARVPQNQIRLTRVPNNRHPAPLPECMKQYQPPNWKALPPAPDLKLSKVENGIVISWKIEGYQEDSYEEIASYQLYAYQETNSPPSTSLWKKIGDVKALPLPMACTLTQFMAGFKYYFAVRAVDVRSRLGPFSLPGSILLLNKM